MTGTSRKSPISGTRNSTSRSPGGIPFAVGAAVCAAATGGATAAGGAAAGASARRSAAEREHGAAFRDLVADFDRIGHHAAAGRERPSRPCRTRASRARRQREPIARFDQHVDDRRRLEVADVRNANLDRRAHQTVTGFGFRHRCRISRSPRRRRRRERRPSSASALSAATATQRRSTSKNSAACGDNRCVRSRRYRARDSAGRDKGRI